MDFQAEIDKCAADGGGVVHVPSGVHVIGTLVLKDGVELHLEKGAVLKGSGNVADYPQLLESFLEGCGQSLGRAMILAANARDIAITGEEGSRILGEQAPFMKGMPGFEVRPFLLRFVGCGNVKIEGVELGQSAAWCCVIQNCEDVAIRDVVIENHGTVNNDGIDIDSSRHVLLENCSVSSDDDALVLKTTFSTENSNIEVRNCQFASLGGAIKFGTESYGDMRRIHIHDCRIVGGEGGAIKVFSVDGAVCEDIRIENIAIDNATLPVFLRLGRRCNRYHSGQEAKTAGEMRRLVFRGIHGKIVSLPRNNGHSCLTVMGLPDKKITDVLFDDVDLQMPGELRNDVPKPDDVPECETAYPEIGYFGTIPASCIFQRHADDIKYDNCLFNLTSPDSRPEKVILE